jgi:hypothetical protein
MSIKRKTFTILHQELCDVRVPRPRHLMKNRLPCQVLAVDVSAISEKRFHEIIIKYIVSVVGIRKICDVMHQGLVLHDLVVLPINDVPFTEFPFKDGVACFVGSMSF